MEGLKGMKKKIQKNIEWLQDGRNKCLGERMGEEISAVLLDAIMKNDPAEAVDEVRVLVKLMEWTLEGRGGPFSVDQVKNCLVPVSSSSSLSSSAPIPPTTKSVVPAVPSPSSNIIPVSPPIVPAQSVATQEEVALLRMQLLEYEKKLAETESNSHKLSQLESELANMSKIISESSSKKSSHQNNTDANEQDIVQGNMLFKQTQSAQSKTVNGEQGSGKNLSSTELQNKIDRIESQIANLERGVIKVEERIDGIDARVEQLESINERLRSVFLLVLSCLIFYISFYPVCFLD
jgi:hypothetical protein